MPLIPRHCGTKCPKAQQFSHCFKNPLAKPPISPPTLSKKHSPDTFESHLCNVVTPYWSPFKALFLFLRRDLQVFLQIRICLPVVGKHCLAFRDVVSVEMETSAGRSGDPHDRRPAFVPGSNWGPGLQMWSSPVPQSESPLMWYCENKNCFVLFFKDHCHLINLYADSN